MHREQWLYLTLLGKGGSGCTQQQQYTGEPKFYLFRSHDEECLPLPASSACGDADQGGALSAADLGDGPLSPVLLA